MIEFGHATHAGLRRVRNEDTYYADAGGGLFLVADGMGGRHRGEAASAMAREVVVELLQRNQELGEAIRCAHRRLHEWSLSCRDGLPRGASLAALQVRDEGYELAWVGDCRVYLWRGGQLIRISQTATAPEARPTGRNNSRPNPRSAPAAASAPATHALGVTGLQELHIGSASGRTQRGDSFLLCTDGLTEEVSEAQLGHVLRRHDLAAQECVEHLLLQALEHGGHDNVTAVLTRFS